jgi:uncharacterized protein
MKVISAALIGVLSSLTLSSNAEAISGQRSNPSFNCNRAQTNAELAICRNATLGAKDRAIASLYPRVRAVTPRANRVALAQDQALFNRSRELCYEPGQDEDECLEAMMSSRVTVLNGWLRNGFPSRVFLR